MEKVYWADLQSALEGTGLDVSLGMPTIGHLWLGIMNGKQFCMTIRPKGEDGFRDFMIISLFGQEEEKVIPLISKFMGYKPFCKYRHKMNSEATATYEWDNKDPAGRLEDLKEDSDVYELQELENGCELIQVPGMENYFQQFTPEIVKKWEDAVNADPDNRDLNEIRKQLPFIKKVMPRVGRNQSMFGLSIISLEGKVLNENEVVQYGLDPLLAAEIIEPEEARAILEWYSETCPSWNSGYGPNFKKEFEVDGIKYRLATDSYRNCRDLNLQVVFS